MVRFEKEVHGVKVGMGYLNEQSAQEMVYFISKAIVQEKILESLNSKKRIYFSIIFDDSSNAKTIDEKEIYVIKSCDMGKPCYDVLVLKQPEEADA